MQHLVLMVAVLVPASGCLLEGIRCNYTKAFFPVSDGQAGTPLVKGQYKAQLHFTIGMLWIFVAQENSTTSGGTPYCDFFDQNQRYLRGSNLLCARLSFPSCLPSTVNTSRA